MTRSILARPAVLLMLCTLVAAQPETTPPVKTNKSPALTRVLAAAEADREAAMVAYLESEMASGAVYAGQFSGLREVKDVAKSLTAMAVDAPAQAQNADAFRNAAIRALRDVVTDQDSQEVKQPILAALQGILADEFDDETVKESTVFALAQFGERGPVDKMLAEAKKASEDDSPNTQVQGWYRLANIQYNMREYSASAEAYAKLFELHEAGKVKLDRLGFGLALTSYNCTCTLALAGKTDAAFEMLAKALEFNKTRPTLDRTLLEVDQDIATLRADPRFGELVAKYFDAAGAKETKGEPAKPKDDSGKDGDK